ncbi:MAG: oxidoreductase [Gallionella sp.]
MPDTLKFALVGYGYAGKTIHAPLIGCVENLNLVAVCSSNPEKVLVDFPAVEVSASLDALFADTQIDAVAIATPNDTHFSLAKQSLLAGKHVVVDKPFTVTAAQARELKSLAEKGKLVLSAFHNRRWDSDFLTLRKVVASQELGELVSFESRFDRFRPEVRTRWREQIGDGTGLWYDLGPHLLDQALQLFGCPIALQADFATQRDGGKATDYFHVLLRYDRLRVILHASMLVADESPRFILRGVSGSYAKFGLDTQEESLKCGVSPSSAHYGEDPREGVLQTPASAPGVTRLVPNLRGDYRLFYSGFRDAVLLNTANPVSLEDAVSTMDLIELASKSAILRKEITLPRIAKRHHLLKHSHAFQPQ